MKLRRVLCAVLLALAAVASAASGAGGASGVGGATGAGGKIPVDRVGSPPAIPGGASLLGPLGSSSPLHITVALTPRDPAALANLATAVSTPGNASYGQYLKPGGFARRFGATATQVAAVTAALRDVGLSPGRLSANRLSIPVSASSTQLSRAFSLNFIRLRLAGGRMGVVNSQAPALPRSVAGLVQGVLGLSSLERQHPLGRPAPAAAATAQAHRLAPRAATGGPQPCAAASAAAPKKSAFTADQIASAYGFGGLYGAGNQGAGETVALYELEPYLASDVNTYAACYGIHPQISNVSVDGGAGSGAGSGEAAFDIEQLIGLAPKAKLIVYEAPNSASNGPGAGPYDLLSTIVSQDRAQVISTSWGHCEALQGLADARAEATLLQQAAAQGQTVVAASGDAGSEDCNAGSLLPNTSLAVDDPGSQPFVTAVGGTTITKLGSPPSETTWNNGGNATALLGTAAGAAGGGVSALWPMPAYQLAAARSLSVIRPFSSGAPCANAVGFCRQVPDVSADADPLSGYLIYYNGLNTAGAGTPAGWQGSGGTSGAAPLWAAVIALADASKSCGRVPIGFANPALYRAAASAYASNFHDILSGNNDFTGSHGGEYPAGAGYDMATGLGTPNAVALATSLCANSLRAANPGNLTSTVSSAVSVSLRALDAGGTAPVYAASGLPPGLSLSRTTGLVTGKPTRTGAYTTTVGVIDAGSDVRGYAFRWTIRAAPKLSRVALRSIGAGRPSVAFTLRAAKAAPSFSTLSIRLPKGLRFAARPHRLTVTGNGAKRLRYRVRVSHGMLTLKLRSRAATVSVKISYAGVSASARLRGRARAHRTGRLRLSVSTTDLSGGVTALSSSVRPRS